MTDINYNINDIAGKRFGRLVAIEFSHIGSSHQAHWQCICDCGRKSTPLALRLVRGQTLSCGCLRLEKTTKHKMCNERVYTAWKNMKKRCLDKKYKAYKNYGERGILVCDRWINSFENFYEDMGIPPSNKHSLDRIDNNGNYEPSNCRWETRYHQQRNKRTNVIITFNGRTQCLKDWATEIKVPYETLRGRIRRGWDNNQVLKEYFPQS